jgi:TusA-related sulfurtransferase
VKTKLALEKLNVGEILEVWILIESQSALNIPQSIRQEGHEIVETLDDPVEPGLQRIFIRKVF